MREGRSHSLRLRTLVVFGSFALTSLAGRTACADEQAAFEVEVVAPERFARIVDNFDQARIARAIRRTLGHERHHLPERSSRSFLSALAAAIDRREPNRRRAREILAALESRGYAALSALDRATLVLAYFKHDYRTDLNFLRNNERTMEALPLVSGADPVLRSLTWSIDGGQLEFRSAEPLPLARFETTLRAFSGLLGIPFDRIGERGLGVEAVHYHASHGAFSPVEGIAATYQLVIALRLAKRGIVRSGRNTAFNRDTSARGHLRWMNDTDFPTHIELRSHWGTPMQELREWFELARLPRPEAERRLASVVEAELAGIRLAVEAGTLRLSRLFPGSGPHWMQHRSSFLVDAVHYLGTHSPESRELAWLLSQSAFRRGLRRQIERLEFAGGFGSDLSLISIVRVMARLPAGREALAEIAATVRTALSTGGSSSCLESLRVFNLAIRQLTIAR